MMITFFSYSIGSNVNYFAKVNVEYKLGDLSTPLETQSWKSLNAPGRPSDEVVVDNVRNYRPLFILFPHKHTHTHTHTHRVW